TLSSKRQTEKAKTLKKTTSLAPDKLALSPKGQEQALQKKRDIKQAEG
ncbi:hypothetical protein Tdes44962_MAKER10488, partial [Teratosphaeria destructans]